MTYRENHKNIYYAIKIPPIQVCAILILLKHGKQDPLGVVLFILEILKGKLSVCVFMVLNKGFQVSSVNAAIAASMISGSNCVPLLFFNSLMHTEKGRALR